MQEWIDALNAFSRAAQAEWHDQPTWNHDRSQRGGDALMAYAHRKACANRTVMVMDFLKMGRFAPPDEKVGEQIARSDTNLWRNLPV